jgi:serine/threonine protein kinase
MAEVKFLHLLRHSHIVRLVGSYFQKRSMSILTYPVADCDLDTFMRQYPLVAVEKPADTPSKSTMLQSLGCMTSALRHIHAKGVKHMDIKPKNILVKSRGKYEMHIYFTDFGISRQVTDPASTETDGPTGRTEKYCSPEVAAEDIRGRSADIFSLGCVFAEMISVLAGRTIEEFEEAHTDDGPSFHRNIGMVHVWLQGLVYPFGNQHSSSEAEGISRARENIFAMLDKEKNKRPSAAELSNTFAPGQCCREVSPIFMYFKEEMGE